MSSNSNVVKPSQSYSTVTQSGPTKDQAIVIEAHVGIPIKDYIYAIGKLTEPTNIRFVSRISNNRICIYLANKKSVEEICTHYPRIEINNIQLEVRPLLTKQKRVILSNVCPVIPHSEIEKIFIKHGIHPTSAITYIRAGISSPGYSHILSFRRQLYVKPEDFDKLPGSFQLHYDDTNYWIYVSSDTPTCFICKVKGHLARQCNEVTSRKNEEST